MSDDATRASRRIMNELGEHSRIPVLNVTEGDVGVLIGFPIAGLFIGALSGLGILVIPLILVGVTVGVAIVYAAPTQLTAWAWLQQVLRFYLTRPAVTHSHPPDSAHAPTDGGLIQYTPFTPDERTQDLTNIRRAWPGTGSIERTDGTMEAVLEIHPSNMDFAMSGDWETIQTAAQEFANAELDFPMKLHATTRSFPVEQLVAQLDDRLGDPDVAANGTFESLLREYREQRPADLAETQQLRYFLCVEIDRLSVYNQYGQERTPGEKLTQFPLLGVLVNPFVTRRADFTDAELRHAMVAKLDDRLRTVRTEFVEAVPGWQATRLGTLELFLLAVDFWNGEEHAVEGADTRMREEAAMGRSPRGDDE